MASYRTYETQSAPGWLRAPYGQSWLRTLGIIHDYNKQLAKLAVRARFPKFGPPDAVGAFGVERGLPQGLLEAPSSYAARVQNPFGYWSIGGTPWGILAVLAGMGYTTAYVVEESGKIWGPSAAVTPPNVNSLNPSAGIPPSTLQSSSHFVWNSLDGQGYVLPAPGIQWGLGPQTVGELDVAGTHWERWMLAFVEVGAGLPSTDPARLWTDIVSPPTTATLPTVNEMNLIRSVLATWKSACSSCMGIVVPNGSDVWTWGFFNQLVWGAAPPHTRKWGDGSGSNVIFTFAKDS